MEDLKKLLCPKPTAASSMEQIMTQLVSRNSTGA